MKVTNQTRKILNRVFTASFLLLLTSFNSCQKHCETCIRINTITMQVIDTQKACNEWDIRHLESRGYHCN